MARTYILAGLPTGWLSEAFSRGWNGVKYVELTEGLFRSIINDPERETIIAVRHQPTVELIRKALAYPERSREQLIVNFNDLRDGDIIIIVAPRNVQERGKDLAVTWQDLSIIKVEFIRLLPTDEVPIFP